MLYVKETNLENFDFWAGAKQVATLINNLDNADECWEMLDEYITTEEGLISETEVNDFVWFYALDMLTENGYLEDEE